MDGIELAVDTGSDTPFEVSAAGTAAHTAVFAQTGAGKSFLLGRYIEELLLKTRAKVVILDPNSDFLKFAQPSRLGDAAFAGAWQSMPSTLLSNREAGLLSPGSAETVNRIAIDWASLTPTEQCRYLGFTTALDYQEYVTVSIVHRVAKARNPRYTLEDFLAALREIRGLLKERDTNGGSIPGIQDDVDASLVPDQSLVKVFTEAFRLAELGIWPNGERTRSVEEVVGDFTSPESEQRLLTLDLPSLEQDRAQAMLEDRTLELLWHNARENWLDAVMRPPQDDPRVPVFVVIDEAHNLAPPEATGEIEASVKARLTKISAEGRKYGLFLVLVTQRPSRISYDILSQVENLFLLKLTNRIDLEFIQRTFGTLEPNAVTRAASLGLGQFILSGRLVAKPTVLKSLPRRTEEGGRSIRADVWIRTPELSRSA